VVNLYFTWLHQQFLKTPLRCDFFGLFGNNLIPLLEGLTDLNLPGSIALTSFLVRMCLGTFYPSLSLSLFSSRTGVDSLMFLLHLAGAPRMFSYLNLLVHSYLFTSILLLVTLPVLAAAITRLLFDREFVLRGSDPIFQHIVCPDAFGFDGLLFAVFSIACLGRRVRGHHMFTVGLSVKTFGKKGFTWLSVLVKSRVSKSDPGLCWIVSCIALFTFGGATGIVISAWVLDKVPHNT
ncbi:unnamed protein product, partial [Taenia asiatica]|uniref:Cytochrome c oxidase subunit 1 n=1 Tax=Taenia asiatica TaxID=60517 RepID=A0A0R3WD89_TAEAS